MPFLRLQQQHFLTSHVPTTRLCVKNDALGVWTRLSAVRQFELPSIQPLCIRLTPVHDISSQPLPIPAGEIKMSWVNIGQQ